jgi:hypothetical protein
MIKKYSANAPHISQVERLALGPLEASADAATVAPVSLALALAFAFLAA